MKWMSHLHQVADSAATIAYIRNAHARMQFDHLLQIQTRDLFFAFSIWLFYLFIVAAWPFGKRPSFNPNQLG